MIKISDWYTQLSAYTFPATFIPISAEEKQLLIKQDYNHKSLRNLKFHIQRASYSIFGRYSIRVDYVKIPILPRCSFGDSLKALKYISKLPVFKDSVVEKLLISPFRRMSTEREFRLFVYNKKLVAMSQLHLNKHHNKLDKTKEKYWTKAQVFFSKIENILPYEYCCIDIYFTSQKEEFILNIHDWDKKNALLFTDWDKLNWGKTHGVRVLSSPKEIKGDVTVDC